MSVPFLLFFVCALLAVLGAVLLIVAWEPIHSALSLVLVMMSLAVLYLAARRGIYRRRADHRLCGRDHGAVRLRHHAAERRNRRTHRLEQVRQSLSACRWLSSCCWRSRTCFGARPSARRSPTARAPSRTLAFPPARFPWLLFQQYLFPFEATSILILIALLGALILARKDE